jgi:hypothetical protein
MAFLQYIARRIFGKETSTWEPLWRRLQGAGIYGSRFPGAARFTPGSHVTGLSAMERWRVGRANQVRSAAVRAGTHCGLGFLRVVEICRTRRSLERCFLAMVLDRFRELKHYSFGPRSILAGVAGLY